LLLTRRGVGKMHQQQLHAWLEDKFTDKENPDTKKFEYAPDWSQIVTELVTATGQTNENPAVNYVLAHLGETVRDKSLGDFDFVPVTSRTTKLFLGLRTQCVQCHDHPFNGDWEQKHFWGVNAFFRQTTASGRPGMMAVKKKGVVGQQFRVSDDKNLNPKGIISFERRSGVLLYTDPTIHHHQPLFRQGVCQPHLGALLRPQLHQGQLRRLRRTQRAHRNQQGDPREARQGLHRLPAQSQGPDTLDLQ
jgi:hypothetical protein